ncbi:MAG: hypothetical protein NTW87_18395 [Planctomycetota bacterium]|nr:hypothetical protein [Planctomycetota bacterium]
MKIGVFGYPGDHVEHAQAVYKALKHGGADTIVCLGGLVCGGHRDDEEAAPGAVLRWLRAEDVPTLCNDTDRQVAGWRLQALENTTGYIQPRVRRFLSAVTREEAQWMYSRPVALPVGNVLCCADNLTIDALFPVPLTSYNANKLFAVLEQKAAFFPSAHGPSLLVRKQDDNVVEAAKYEDVEEPLDCVKVAGIIGGILGYPPLNGDVSWGAIVDGAATHLSLVCLDTKTHASVPERATMLLQQASFNWRA